MVSKEEIAINKELFPKHFKLEKARELFRIKDKKENKKLVGLIKSGLSDLKDEI